MWVTLASCSMIYGLCRIPGWVVTIVLYDIMIAFVPSEMANMGQYGICRVVEIPF